MDAPTYNAVKIIGQAIAEHKAGGPSREFAEIMSIHNHDRDDLRLIHHWMMAPPANEDWEMEAGAGNIVAACIPTFFEENNIIVHSATGPRGGLPKYRSVQSIDGPIRTPREVAYFVEHQKSGERFVLAVETSHCGDIEISMYSPNASVWIEMLRAFAKKNNHLRGRTFDLLGKRIDHGNITLDDVILTENQSQVINRHIIGYAKKILELKERGARGQRGVLLEGVPGHTQCRVSPTRSPNPSNPSSAPSPSVGMILITMISPPTSSRPCSCSSPRVLSSGGLGFGWRWQVEASPSARRCDGIPQPEKIIYPVSKHGDRWFVKAMPDPVVGIDGKE